MFALSYPLLRFFFPPLLFLGCAIVSLDWVANLAPIERVTLSQAPYFIGVFVAFVAYGFKSSQVFFLNLVLMLTYVLIQKGLQTPLGDPATYTLFSILSLLTPLHIMIISSYSERGIASNIGLTRLGFVVLTYVCLWYAWSSGQLIGLFNHLPSAAFNNALSDTFLTELASWAYGASLLVTLGFLAFRRTAAAVAVLASLVASLLILIWFNRVSVSQIMTLAALVSLAVAVLQQSYSMAFIDELTEIPSRRALNAKLLTLGRSYAIAMLDIDHFKKFNDTYGHDIGDQVLRMVAARINQVKGGGRAYRYGGEEFTIVFNHKSEEEAKLYLEMVRQTIANYPMRIRGNDRPDDSKQGEQMRRRNNIEASIVTVTVSIGCAECSNEHRTTEEVIKAADKALYAAKGNGRNQTICFHSQPSTRNRRAKRDYA